MTKKDVCEALKKACEMVKQAWREEKHPYDGYQAYDRVQGCISGCWRAALLLQLDDLAAELEVMAAEYMQEHVKDQPNGYAAGPEEEEDTCGADWPEEEADAKEPAETAEPVAEVIPEPATEELVEAVSVKPAAEELTAAGRPAGNKEICEALRDISKIAVDARTKGFGAEENCIYFGEILGCYTVAMRLCLDDLADELAALLGGKGREETA